MKRTILTLTALGVFALAVSASGDFLGVRLVEDEAINAEARAALADFGVENADTARVIRVYAVYTDDGPKSDVEVYGADVIFITLSPFHSFFNHPLGTGLPPQAELLPDHPALAFDTFLTVNATSQSGEPLVMHLSASDMVSDEKIEGGVNITVEGFIQDVGVPMTPLGEGEVGTLIVQMTLLGAQCAPEVGSTNFYEWPVASGSWSVFGAEGGSFGFTGDYPCYANLDNDTGNNAEFMINAGDLAQLLAVWGPHESCERADYNSDGVVNGVDLAVLLAEWGNCFCCEHVYSK